MTSPATHVSASPEQASLGTWVGFAALCIGMFMAILDIQIVATSLPEIQSAISIQPDQMSWIQTAYLIAEVITIPLTGRLTRTFGLKYLGLAATIAFALASTWCAFSTGFTSLILGRILQGLAGGCLIPAVFSAVFLLFPAQRQGIATGIAGALAVLAPAIGPLIGGWITDTYSWHWLFLINLGPAIGTVLLVQLCLPGRMIQWQEMRNLDWLSLLSMAAALAALEIALKDGPQHGWLTTEPLALSLIFILCGALFCRRTWRSATPIVDLRLLRLRDYATGCGLSFFLGMGLFGGSFMMPVFLGYVRLHTAFEIGQIMLVTGLTQLIVSPIVVSLERWRDKPFFNPRHLSLIGFVIFALGLYLNAGSTFDWDEDQLFWPQIIRGGAIMFCLLPPTRLALDRLPAELVADGSALINLMRNLGGAIGLAIIDTVIWQRSPIEAHRIVDRLLAGDANAARMVGLDTDKFVGKPLPMPDQATQDMLKPLIERAGLVTAINEAWLVIALAVLIGALLILLSGGKKHLRP